MAERTDTTRSAYFRELPVAAVVYSNLLSQRLTTHAFPVSAKLKHIASTGLTAILVVVSLVGLYLLGSLTLPELLSKSTPATASTSVAVPATSQKPQAPTAPAYLSRSVPTRLEIPAIDVDASVVSVGQDSEGAMEVPEYDVVGWYNLGPSPGELGPAIINGHVDSAVSGPAVFWNLEKLQAGDEVRVAREDGMVATFIVERSEVYDQNNFPTEAVYGNIDYPGLRLITCEGDFNYLTRHYSHNLVVYARATL